MTAITRRISGCCCGGGGGGVPLMVRADRDAVTTCRRRLPLPPLRHSTGGGRSLGTRDRARARETRASSAPGGPKGQEKLLLLRGGIRLHGRTHHHTRACGKQTRVNQNKFDMCCAAEAVRRTQTRARGAFFSFFFCFLSLSEIIRNDPTSSPRPGQTSRTKRDAPSRF